MAAQLPTVLFTDREGSSAPHPGLGGESRGRLATPGEAGPGQS